MASEVKHMSPDAKLALKNPFPPTVNWNKSTPQTHRPGPTSPYLSSLTVIQCSDAIQPTRERETERKEF